MKYKPTYRYTSFFADLSLNTKSFVLNITLSPFFHSLVSFLLLFACYFIFSWTFLNTTPDFSCIFFILSIISIVFSTFPFLLISALILNSLLWFAISKDILVAEYCHKLHSACISTTSRPIFTNKLHCKAPNEGYLHIYGIYKSDNKKLRYQAISNCKSFVC